MWKGRRRSRTSQHSRRYRCRAPLRRPPWRKTRVHRILPEKDWEECSAAPALVRKISHRDSPARIWLEIGAVARREGCRDRSRSASVTTRHEWLRRRRRNAPIHNNNVAVAPLARRPTILIVAGPPNARAAETAVRLNNAAAGMPTMAGPCRMTKSRTFSSGNRSTRPRMKIGTATRAKATMISADPR